MTKELTLDQIVTSLLMQNNTAESRAEGRKMLQEWAEEQCKVTAEKVKDLTCEIYYDSEGHPEPDLSIKAIKFSEVSPFKSAIND